MDNFKIIYKILKILENAMNLEEFDKSLISAESLGLLFYCEKEDEFMKWIKNIENIARVNSPGNCPYCENSDTEYTAVRVHKNFGYAVVWCNKCKKACNISRMEITGKTVVGKPIPKNLIFTTM